MIRSDQPSVTAWCTVSRNRWSAGPSRRRRARGRGGGGGAEPREAGGQGASGGQVERPDGFGAGDPLRLFVPPLLRKGAEVDQRQLRRSPPTPHRPLPPARR